MRKLPFPRAALLGAVALAGCAGMTDTQRRTLTGAVGGTAGGYPYDRTRQDEQRACREGRQRQQR
jgi:hypothetical protein